MSQYLRWMLIVGCLMLAALELPRSTVVVAEDLDGPYAAWSHESAALERGELDLDVETPNEWASEFQPGTASFEGSQTDETSR